MEHKSPSSPSLLRGKLGSKSFKPIRSDSCKVLPVPQHNPNKRPSLVESLSFYMKNTSLDQEATGVDSTSPKTPKRIISTWKTVCDKSKDRTRELIKKWKTGEADSRDQGSDGTRKEEETDGGGGGGVRSEKTWSVHVWATWVKRCESEDEMPERNQMSLSNVQQEKLKYFFSQLLDGDHDELISCNDFHNLAERIRRFAEWSENCGEYFVVEQIRCGFLDTFISSKKEEDNLNLDIEKIYIDQDHWLKKWNELIKGAASLNSFPLWVQYFPRILFQAINKSGSGLISKEELRQFLFFIVGLDSKCVDQDVDRIYLVLTANGDTGLDFHVFQLSFINFLLGRHPNGPGQYLFGPCANFPDTFPVDYSALNADLTSIEHYSPSRQSNRSSVIV
ncbi:hypothetical protein M8J77_010400 [Diaphorina citri]|nr:hypothetical protein M8J77_010400 [Diaphorina citri]